MSTPALRKQRSGTPTRVHSPTLAAVSALLIDTSPRVVFPLVDALCWLLASHRQILDVLNAEQEVELAKRIEAGLFAEEKLNSGIKMNATTKG